MAVRRSVAATRLGVKAIAIYRERFKPSDQLAKPYVLVGMNVIAAESDDEARRLATTQQMSFADLLRDPVGVTLPQRRVPRSLLKECHEASHLAVEPEDRRAHCS